jgi:hypothetical protein
MAQAPEVDEALTPLQQRQAAQSVDRAIEWLAAQQRAEGAFPSPDHAQPGITGLGVLALLSRGHLPGVESMTVVAPEHASDGGGSGL